MNRIDMLRRHHELSKRDPRFTLCEADLALLKQSTVQEDISMGTRKSATDFTDIFGTNTDTRDEVRKATVYGQDEDRKLRMKDADEDEDDAKTKFRMKDADEEEDEQKDADEDDDDAKALAKERQSMSPADRKRRAVAEKNGYKIKSTFGDVLFPTPAVREFDIQDLGGREEPEPADGEGSLDEQMRQYSDEIYETLSGKNSPGTGIVDTWLGDTRDVPVPGGPGKRHFMDPSEGDAGRVGGEDRGASPVRPPQPYEMLLEGKESGPVKVGNFCVMSPLNSGLAPSSKPAFPDSKATVLRRVRKSKPGLFSNIIGDLSTNSGQDFGG